MFAELFILLPVGVLFIVLGLLIWKKEKITLIHDYHWDRVKEEDKSAYTALIGKGVFIIGVCAAVTNTGWGWLAFTAGFVVSVVLFLRAQFRYNR